MKSLLFALIGLFVFNVGYSQPMSVKLKKYHETICTPPFVEFPQDKRELKNEEVCYSMQHLYNKLNGKNWEMRDGAVRVEKKHYGYVLHVNLSGMGLEGNIENFSYGRDLMNLKRSGLLTLASIDLSNNDFSGEIEEVLKEAPFFSNFENNEKITGDFNNFNAYSSGDINLKGTSIYGDVSEKNASYGKYIPNR